MKNSEVKTLMNEVTEKSNNNQMSSLCGGVKRGEIDHIGPVNKSFSSKIDDSESESSSILRSDAIKAAAEAAAKAAAAEAAAEAAAKAAEAEAAAAEKGAKKFGRN